MEYLKINIKHILFFWFNFTYLIIIYHFLLFKNNFDWLYILFILNHVVNYFYKKWEVWVSSNRIKFFLHQKLKIIFENYLNKNLYINKEKMYFESIERNRNETNQFFYYLIDNFISIFIEKNIFQNENENNQFILYLVELVKTWNYNSVNHFQTKKQFLKDFLINLIDEIESKIRKNQDLQLEDMEFLENKNNYQKEKEESDLSTLDFQINKKIFTCYENENQDQNLNQISDDDEEILESELEDEDLEENYF